MNLNFKALRAIVVAFVALATTACSEPEPIVVYGLTLSQSSVVFDAEGEEVKVHLYERTRGDDFPNSPTSSSAHTDCFAGCQGLSDYANIPEDWK